MQNQPGGVGSLGGGNIGGNDQLKNPGFMSKGNAGATFLPNNMMGGFNKTQDPLIIAEAEKKLKQHRHML